MGWDSAAPSHMNLRATGSMPVDGSSRKIILGSPMVAARVWEEKAPISVKVVRRGG